MSAATKHASTERVLPGIPESVRASRTMVREALGDGHPDAEAAALCVSELVTNSIVYTRSGLPGGTVTVTVDFPDSGGVLVSVLDGGSQVSRAHARAVRGCAEHGHGLRIVAALSAAWGTEPTPHGTWRTWCWVGGGS
jgi:anti-sigma regulatory factor (Ser/Thr protein kinase)